ncbi:MAG: hypothetical protein IJ371_01230 [Clostridia bacterium]|nr:hypothetical protein [Clostridia bacterium]
MNKLIKTYLGFCIKSRSIVIGQDRLKVSKDKIHLIVYCSTASQNLQDLIVRMCDKFKCKSILMDEKLEDYTNITGCKVLGITNKSLADQIIKVAENKD